MRYTEFNLPYYSDIANLHMEALNEELQNSSKVLKEGNDPAGDNMRLFLQSYGVTPVVGRKYNIVSIYWNGFEHNWLNIATNSNNFILIKIESNCLWFDVNGKNTRFPANISSYPERTMATILFNSNEEKHQFDTLLKLKFADWKHTQKDFVVSSLNESQQLDEVSMKPSALQAFLNSPEAEGMTMGIEFEMAVPNVSTDEGNDFEADYSRDERADSIDGIIDFFKDGDMSTLYGDSADRLQTKLAEEYWQWQDEEGEKYKDRYRDDWEDYARRALRDHFDLDEFEDEARERLGDMFDDEKALIEMERVLRDEKIESIFEEGEEHQYTDAIETANEQMREDFANSSDGDERSWLEDIGVSTMVDAAERWNLDWGYIISSESGNEDIEQIGQRFGDDLGVEVQTSSSYHGNSGPDRFDSWNIEPDGSITSENGDGGLEFISPVLSLRDGIDAINQVFEWANDNGCYTNKSTGMHINISVPNFDQSQVDYVKLALFSGDEYVLEQFGRQYNNYTSSALKLIKRRFADTSRDTAVQLISQMRQHLNLAASKSVISRNGERQTSINLKEGWVEFRSPGGDYLNDSPEKLTNTALRLAMALKISMDPEAHKQEYAKKLYKMASEYTNANDESDIEIFTRYMAAQITKEQLVTYLKTKQLKRTVSKIPEGTLQHWIIYRSGQGQFKVDIIAPNARAAIRSAQAQNAEWNRLDDMAFSVTQTGQVATPAEKAQYEKDNAPLEGGNLYKVTNKLTGGEALLTGNSEQDVINIVTQKFGTSPDDYTITLASQGLA